MKARTVKGLLVIVVVTFGAMSLPGCKGVPEERIAQLESVITTAETQSKALDMRIDQVDAVLVEAKRLLADPNLGSEFLAKIRADVVALEAKLAQARPIKATLDAQLTAYRAQLAAALAAGPITPQAEWQLYGQGVTSIAPVLPAPWNAWLAIIGAGIGLVGGVVGSLTKGRSDKVAVKGIVNSVSQLLGSSVVTDQEAAKCILAREQVKTPGAAEAVREALANKG